MGNELQVMAGGMDLSKADPAAVAAAESAKQRIQAAYVIAMHKPRNVDQARVKILENCKRPAFAEKVEYSKPVGNKRIIGPSIRFAEAALRDWGNCLSESQVVYEDDYIRRVRVIITDLESNASFTKEIQIAKTVERKNKSDREVLGERKNTVGDTVYIVKATDDELANKEASAVSKAIRNEGLRIIPSDIVEEAINIARATLDKADAKDPDAARKQIIDAFAYYGIKPIDLEKYLKHPISQVGPADLKDLRSVYEAIRSGEAKWSDYTAESEAESKPKVSPFEKPPRPHSDDADAKAAGLVSEPQKAAQPTPSPQDADYSKVTYQQLLDTIAGALTASGLAPSDADRWAFLNKCKPLPEMPLAQLRGICKGIDKWLEGVKACKG